MNENEFDDLLARLLLHLHSHPHLLYLKLRLHSN